MPRNGDGIYTRSDRPGYWISYKDADGRRRRRKVEAPNRTKAATVTLCPSLLVKFAQFERLRFNAT
jgi:hypothetical protein